ncbi:MAG: hypothetical protein WBO21_03940, partial [Acidimicrobiia bacterium]
MSSDKTPDSADKAADDSADGAVVADGVDVETDVVGVDADEVAVEAADVALVDPETVAALQAENAELKKQLAAQQPEKSKPSSTTNPLWRKIVVGVLVVLAVVALVASVSVTWVKTTIQNEDQFVATLEPLPQEEAVASVVALRVAEGIVEAAGVEAWVAGNLPEGLKFLSIPVTESISAVIAGAANEVIVSDAFRSVWSAALRVTHKAASAVISGDGRALESEGGVVSLNLDEIAGVVVDKVEATGLELPDSDVEIGSIVLYEDQQLAAVQSLAQAIDTLGWFLPLLALIFIAAAIWLSRDRRRATAFIGFGTAIGVVVSLISLRYGRNYVVNAIEDVAKQQAAGEAWDLVLYRLYQMMWAALILALIVGLAAWIVGPSLRSKRIRTWASGTVDRWRQPVEGNPNVFTNFVADWKPTIEVVAVVLGLAFVLFGPPPSGFSVLLTA